MKQIKLLVLGLLFIASYTSCKDAKKEKDVQQEEVKAVTASQFSLVADSTQVSFTAYKTTEKLPVGGKFTKIDIANSNSGDTALEALNGTEFSIPVSSLFTNDATGTRDPKILEFFFGVMTNTEFITGVFHVTGNDKCSIAVTLNGETASIPLDYEKVSETEYIFKGDMDLENWNAMAAVAALNKACKVLHTGPDGVTKTWSEVAVRAKVLLEKN
ncbi:hypothetical protein K8352_10225 [Flavobacteriaceae bacterium F89]|uniref:Uncharacterized protein n=1 Tax=Cerina litoralis TaxID=2874477 RepID=A0AAE3EUF4_9FLAO|nr:hypothetical protein [Cerina litoralis]MCG2461123.1 hypothetical protein [Cerina litoralis]